MENNLARRVAAEFIGTFLLLTAAGHLFFVAYGSPGPNTTTQLISPDKLSSAFSAGLTLAVLVVVFGAISGGHFNPAVSLAAFLFRGLNASEFAAYAVAQITGGIGGIITAKYLEGGLPNGITTGQAGMADPWKYFSEFIATLVLVTVVHASIRAGRGHLVPLALGGWVVVMVCALPQSYGNIAVSIAEVFGGKNGPSFAAAMAFVGVQVLAAVGAWVLVSYMYPEDKSAPAPAASFTTF